MSAGRDAAAPIPAPTATLVESYRTAQYHVAAPGGAFVLAIGAASAGADAWLAAAGATRLAIVTGCNPLSEPLDAAANAAAQRRLEARLAALGRTFVPALNHDPAGRWPDEPSCCIADLEPAVLAGLLVEFRQYAAVLLDAGGPARLRWHPALPAD